MSPDLGEAQTLEKHGSAWTLASPATAFVPAVSLSVRQRIACQVVAGQGDRHRVGDVGGFRGGGE